MKIWNYKCPRYNNKHILIKAVFDEILLRRREAFELFSSKSHSNACKIISVVTDNSIVNLFESAV